MAGRGKKPGHRRHNLEAAIRLHGDGQGAVADAPAATGRAGQSSGEAEADAEAETTPVMATLLVLVAAVAVGGYVVVQIGMWKAFIALFRDQRRRGWFK